MGSKAPPSNSAKKPGRSVKEKRAAKAAKAAEGKKPSAG